jgi:hypothetical protein
LGLVGGCDLNSLENVDVELNPELDGIRVGRGVVAPDDVIESDIEDVVCEVNCSVETDTPDGHGYAGTVRSDGKAGTDGTEGKDTVGTAGTDGTALVTVSCTIVFPLGSIVATTCTPTVRTFDDDAA